MEAKIDKLDERLISALRHDARASVSTLAQDLGVSRTTLRARLARLQDRGDIVGFTVILKQDVQTDPVRGLTMIEIEERGKDRILRQLRGMAEIRAVHSTNGRWDLIAEIGAETLEVFDAVLSRIRLIEGVTKSETNLLLSTHKRH